MGSGGLLIGGRIVPVDGVDIIGPHDAAWSHLSPGDCCPRPGGAASWVRQWFLHKTIGDDPEKLLPGAGPAGGEEVTAEAWANDPRHSGAHLVTGHNGRVACLADLLLVEAFDATVSNRYSVGHETKELPGGGFYEAAARATIATCLAGCRELGIQWQCPKLPYRGVPLRRMADGGRDLVGIFGHRDNTTQRGRWDPGDIFFEMLVAAGVRAFDFDADEDLAFWKPVQADLAARGLYHGAIDGVPGPGTTAALRADGYIDGIFALGKAA